MNTALKNLHNQLNNSTGDASTLSKKLREEQERNQSYTEKMNGLHDNIEEMNKKMQQHQERYGHYLKLIAANEPDVIITN